MILSWNKAVAQLQPIHSHQQCSVYHINYPTQYGSQIYIKCLLCRNQAKIDQVINEAKIDERQHMFVYGLGAGIEFNGDSCVYIFIEAIDRSLQQDLKLHKSAGRPYTEEQ